MDYLGRSYDYLGLEGCRGNIGQSIRYQPVQDTEKLEAMRIKLQPITIDFITKIYPEDIIGVYFNDKKMTTVIKWKDGTVTKVKTQINKGDTYNPETGMAMCICKKAFGNRGNFNEVFKKWLPK